MTHNILRDEKVNEFAKNNPGAMIAYLHVVLSALPDAEPCQWVLAHLLKEVQK